MAAPEFQAFDIIRSVDMRYMVEIHSCVKMYFVVIRNTFVGYYSLVLVACLQFCWPTIDG